MAKQSKSRVVPGLRFPEFRGAGEWVRVRLIDTADQSVKWSFIGGPFGSNLTSSDYAHDGVRIIQLQNIGDGEFVDSYRIFTTPEKAEDLLSCNIYPGDIILSKMGDPVGRACIVPAIHEKYVMCSDGIRLVVNEYDYSKYFVYSTINAPTFRSLVDKTATGSTRKRIGLDELRNLPLLVPKKAEQQKIAECLMSLDELIAAQGRKVVSLKTYKRGLMQQLFPREGETLPRLRFPEFRDASEWEPTTLDALVDLQSGGTPSKANLAFWNGSIPWVSAKDMKRLFLDDAEDHISATAVDDGAKLVPAGTVLMLTRGMTLLKDVPICVLRCEMSFNQDVKALLPKGETDGLFVALLLLGNKQRLLRMVDIAGHGTGKLNTDELKALELAAPKPAEQQRIADFLSSLDAQIAAVAEKLAALKNHKDGLMQQIFPSLEEAT